MTNRERFLAGEIFSYGEEDRFFKLVILDDSSAKEHYLLEQLSETDWQYRHPLIPYDQSYAFGLVAEIMEIQDQVCFAQLEGIVDVFEEELCFDQMHFDFED
ncbi:hypothetical protein LZD49_32205 [Dyadobacter sp. CY261]|uniref:hypothetical protein n=1 Tax=Dyadobacter sp. CY261 TaxID=2907203 RepID=UPI001F3F9889|nr:hypothetical protein [Dyadobacter sp. CY261]MCF0075190.1 hypothetical protein [Dyadobacter sp. CY261]